MCRLIRVGIILWLSAAMWRFPSTAESFQHNTLSKRSFQRQYFEPIHVLYNKPKKTKIDEPTSSHDDADREEGGTDAIAMESLDVVLERARKRKPSWMLKGVAFLNEPAGKVIPWLTKLDFAFSSLALFVGSYGFSVGYILGKWMTNDPQNQVRLRNLLSDESMEPWQRSLLFQYLPVLLAVVLDQAVSLAF